MSPPVFNFVLATCIMFILKITISTQHIYDLKKGIYIRVRKITLFTFSLIFGNIIDLHQQYIFPVYVKKESREKCPDPAIVQITVTGGNLKFVDQTFRQIEDRIKEKQVKMVMRFLGKFIFLLLKFSM